MSSSPASRPSFLDAALDALVVPGFTRFGPLVRSRLGHWDEHDAASPSMSGKVVVVTGASSGLGLAAARQLATRGASVVMVGRDERRLAAGLSTVAAAATDGAPSSIVADMGDLSAVRGLAGALLADAGRVDVLVHNAGALSADRSVSPEGIESTVAAQVVGPHLLTTLLRPALSTGRAGEPGRVVTVSSGGMYASPLRVHDIEMGDDYRGAEQYARAKRAQVTLNEMWAERVDPSEIVFHAMHPGWADTPGVRSSLPGFRRLTGPLLRSADEGADTITWLCADPGAAAVSGLFWCDRASRPIHRLPSTRRSDTPERRTALWEWVESAAQRMR